MKKVLWLILLITICILPSRAGVVIYTDATAFQAALLSYSVETFTGNVINTAGLSFSSTAGSITGELFSDRVVNGADSTTWTLPSAMNGFGGYWDLTPQGAGQGLEFFIDGLTLVPQEVPNSYSGQFFGFISDATFNSVKIDGGTQLPGSIAESYNVDNLTFGVAGSPPPPPSDTPEPATFGLIGAALLAIGARSFVKRS